MIFTATFLRIVELVLCIILLVELSFMYLELGSLHPIVGDDGGYLISLVLNALSTFELILRIMYAMKQIFNLEVTIFAVVLVEAY